MERALDGLDGLDGSYEVVCVDDGSTHASAERLIEKRQRSPVTALPGSRAAAVVFEDQMDRENTSTGCWIMSRRGCGRHLEDAASRDLEVLRRPTSLTRRYDFLKAAYGTPLVHGHS